MQLIDEQRAHLLYDAMGPAVETSGGSAANTVAGVASFGGTAAFIGTVRDDQLGEVFAPRHPGQSAWTSTSPPAPTARRTARCLILVTPDAQRTMNTYLGHLVPRRPGQRRRRPRRRGQGRLLRGLPLGPAPDHRGHHQGLGPGPATPGARWPSPCPTPSASTATGPSSSSWSTSASTSCSPTTTRSARCTRSTTFEDAVDAVRGPLRDRLPDPLGGRLGHRHRRTRRIAGARPPDRGGRHHRRRRPLRRRLPLRLTQGLDLATCGRLGSAAAAEVISHLGARPLVALTEVADAVLV